MKREPFWEQIYRNSDTDPFGSASTEVLELANSLTPDSSVLDLGCGAGRNALPLVRAGMKVTAIDASQTACARLRAAARNFATPIHVVELDIRRFEFTQHYDLVIAHGVLHLLPIADRVKLLNRIQSNTVSGGINVIAVFTNRTFN